MVRCVLHVGFGKTGTSALQTYLSRNPWLEGTRGHRYVVVDGCGRVLDGDAIQAAAAGRAHRYLVSTPRLWHRGDLEDIGRRLARLGRNDVLVLSQEDWARNGRSCHELRALERLEIRAHVVAYVRPQVEWFNSGWWQWWTWHEEFDTPPDVLKKWRSGFLCWAKQLKWWAGNPNVSRLSVRLYRRDTVSDFMGVLGATEKIGAEEVVVNSSLSPLHIKLLKSMPGLRRPHTPWYDWVLQGCLPSTEEAPWALTRDDMQTIVDVCKEDNRALMALLTPEDAEAMRQDMRWWSIEPYLDRAAVTEAELRCTESDLKVAVQALLGALAGERGKG